MQNTGGSGAGSTGRQYVWPRSSRTTEQSRPVHHEYTASAGVRWITATLPTSSPPPPTALMVSVKPQAAKGSRLKRRSCFIPPSCALKVNKSLPARRFAAKPATPLGSAAAGVRAPWQAQAGEKIRVVDIFDEVEEDLRAERAEKLLKKYAWLIIALAVATVAAVAGWQLWTRYQIQQDAAAATRYVAVQNAIEQPGTSKADQIASLGQLAASAPEGYKTLARLRAAGLKADTGDLPGAIALWNAVAADSSADPLLRDFASLMATARELDRGDPVQIESRLKPLAEPGNAWSTLAREQLAMLDLRQGKLEDARQKLQMLTFDADAPSGLRARASALLAGLGSLGSK